MVDFENWTPQNIGIALLFVFLFAWTVSGNFFIAVFIVVLILFRVPGVFAGLRKALDGAPKRYSSSSYEPYSVTPNEDAELMAMPRYSEGRVDVGPPYMDELDRSLTRSYEADDEDEDEVAPEPAPTPVRPPATQSTRYSTVKMPPRKPVDLPRHRPR